MLRDVAGELLGVELTRGDHEVVDRLLGLEPEHDRRVAELEVQVEQQRALLLELREAGGEVRRGDGLAGAALGREHGDDPAVTCLPALGREPATGVRGLAEREDDVLGQLRKQQDVGDAVGVEGLVEQRRRLAGGEDDDRRARVLADHRDLVGRQGRRAGAVHDHLEVAAGERRRGLGHVLAPADEVDLDMRRERFAQAIEAFAGARHVDANGLALSVG